jgi:hypothetical protein
VAPNQTTAQELWYSTVYTDKKEKKLFLIYEEIQRDRCKVTNDLLIYGENICAFSHILGSPSSYMTLHPIPSEIPYI